MGIESAPDMNHTGPNRPVRDTKERLQIVKPRKWLNRDAPGEIRGGIQEMLRKFTNGDS